VWNPSGFNIEFETGASRCVSNCWVPWSTTISKFISAVTVFHYLSIHGLNFKSIWWFQSEYSNDDSTKSKPDKVQMQTGHDGKKGSCAETSVRWNVRALKRLRWNVHALSCPGILETSSATEPYLWTDRVWIFLRTGVKGGKGRARDGISGVAPPLPQKNIPKDGDRTIYQYGQKDINWK
jgi:hypothetical protein